MALGFIKKIFSFGKDEPQVPVPTPARADEAALPLPEALPASPSGEQLISEDDLYHHREAEAARIIAEREAAETRSAENPATDAMLVVDDDLPEATETLIVPDELDEEEDPAVEA